MSKNFNTSDSNSLLKTLIAGDKLSFDKVYGMYYEGITTYLFKYSSDKDTVQDVVQDTFLVLWDNRRKLTISTSLKGYLYKIAFNKLMQKYRTSSRQHTMLMSYYNLAVSNNFNWDEDDSDKTKQLEKLNYCLELLPERCKEVFMAKKISGMKYQSISENLRISIKTVEGHITKAYVLLRKCMQVKTSK